jgi:hypothetical protein
VPAPDRDGTAEGLDTIFQPDQARAPDRVGSPGPVVANAEAKDPVGRLGVDLYHRGIRVLGGIGEGLGDDVVRGDFNVLREPRFSPHIELDGNGAPARERLQRRAEASLGQDRRMDAARHFPQIVLDAGESLGDAGQIVVELAASGRGRHLHGSKREGERHEPLLGTVVQVTLDLSAGLVGSRDDPCPGGLELSEVLRIGDRRRDKLGKRGEARLGVRGQRLLADRGGNEDAPEAALDRNRRPGR